jgi:hypothetical protein
MRLEVPVAGFRSGNGKKVESKSVAKLQLLGKSINVPVKMGLLSTKDQTIVNLYFKVDLEKLIENPEFKSQFLEFSINEVEMNAYVNPKN